MCNIWRKSPSDTIPLSKAKSMIDNLSALGCFYLSFCGGEPLLAEYLFELAAYAKKSKIKYIHLVTNGYMINAKTASRFNDSGITEISISIDGPQDFHNKNRGVSDAYQKSLRALEYLKEYAPGVKLGLNAVFFPQDPFQCLHVLELARRYGVFMKVQPVNQHPVFNKANYALTTPVDISPVKVKHALDKLRGEKLVINSDVFLKNIYNFYFDQDKLIFSKSPCYFGYHHIEILEDGRISPCLEGTDWQGGFDFQENLHSLIASDEYTKLCEKLKLCQRCKRAYYICYYEPRIVFPINNFFKSLIS